MNQIPPFAVQVELVEGCNLYCTFCGLQGIREQREKNFKYMVPSMLESLVSQMATLKWNARIEFAMHGEPTMHPDADKMIEIVREFLPRASIMMTSNGGGLLADTTNKIEKLFKSGLNILALDDYDSVKIVTKIRARLDEVRSQMPNVQIYDYPKQRQGNPHRRRTPDERVLTLVQDISRAKEGTHSSLNNHAGAAFPKNDKMAGKRCAKPFRELAVRWDGNVAVCCNDWRGEYKIGNVNDDGLDEVWQHPRMQAARERLYHGMRDRGPCHGCDATSYRPGLLPDHLGKVVLPKPDEENERLVAEALAGKPYAVPVHRPWEKENADNNTVNGTRGSKPTGYTAQLPKV